MYSYIIFQWSNWILNFFLIDLVDNNNTVLSSPRNIHSLTPWWVLKSKEKKVVHTDLDNTFFPENNDDTLPFLP